MPRTEKYKDGKPMEVIDTRTLEEAKAETIAVTKETCGQLIEEQAPSFKQINAAMGLYDAAKCQAIKDAVQSLRDKQSKMEDEINALTNIDDVANYQIVW